MSSENHNHITRVIKSPGQCYSCDRYHAVSAQKEIQALRNIIYTSLELFENHGSDSAHRFLTKQAQERRIDRLEGDPVD